MDASGPGEERSSAKYTAKLSSPLPRAGHSALGKWLSGGFPGLSHCKVPPDRLLLYPSPNTHTPHPASQVGLLQSLENTLFLGHPTATGLPWTTILASTLIISTQEQPWWPPSFNLSSPQKECIHKTQLMAASYVTQSYLSSLAGYTVTIFLKNIFICVCVCVWCCASHRTIADV